MKASGVAVGDNDLVLLNSVHYESESSSGTSMAILLMIGYRIFAVALYSPQANRKLSLCTIRSMNMTSCCLLWTQFHSGDEIAA